MGIPSLNQNNASEKQIYTTTSLSITMQSGQQVVYPKESKRNQYKACYNENTGIIAPPALLAVQMQIYGIDNPGH